MHWAISMQPSPSSFDTIMVANLEKKVESTLSNKPSPTNAGIWLHPRSPSTNTAVTRQNTTLFGHDHENTAPWVHT